MSSEVVGRTQTERRPVAPTEFSSLAAATVNKQLLWVRGRSGITVTELMVSQCDYCFCLRCDATQLCGMVRTFRRNILPPSSGYKLFCLADKTDTFLLTPGHI